MYLSRITLHTGQLSPAQLLHLVDRGEYVMHQWLWDLFPGGKERQFLYRREELQGAFRFFVLSQERPAESETFTIECRSFTPELSTGQQLCFNLRANPTICKAGKRHDLLMEAKRQVRGQAEGSDVWLHQQQAALDWLAAQGERSGFTLLDTGSACRCVCRRYIQTYSGDDLAANLSTGRLRKCSDGLGDQYRVRF